MLTYVRTLRNGCDDFAYVRTHIQRTHYVRTYTNRYAGTMLTKYVSTYVRMYVPTLMIATNLLLRIVSTYVRT